MQASKEVGIRCYFVQRRFIETFVLNPLDSLVSIQDLDREIASRVDDEQMIAPVSSTLAWDALFVYGLPTNRIDIWVCPASGKDRPTTRSTRNSSARSSYDRRHDDRYSTTARTGKDQSLAIFVAPNDHR